MLITIEKLSLESDFGYQNIYLDQYYNLIKFVLIK